VTGNSKQAIAALVEGGVNDLLALLTVRAAHPGRGLEDPAMIEPIRERFSPAATIERIMHSLQPSFEKQRLRDTGEALITLGRG
jgi:hypothetical protein